MKNPIDLKTWNRRQHFELFSAYDCPFWSVTANVDCSRMYGRAKVEGFPFYLGYHFASVRAANAVNAFRQRIEHGLPVEYDTVHVSTTSARPDGTFGFALIPYSDDFDEFVQNGIAESKRIRAATDLSEPYVEAMNDVIYYAVLRGVSFTSASQPYRKDGSIPVLGFGEMIDRTLSHCVHGHHALVDGQHVGLYFKLFQ
jgi:chloramphenicol O-acetyltransferase type A